MDQVDILTGTLGKALGEASGGYTSGRKAIIDLLRQRSRPYLFSNTLAPAIAGGSLKVLELLSSSTDLRDQLEENTRYFREGMSKLGFDILAGSHPITTEVREAREKHASQFGYDLNEIFRDLRARQQASSREYVRFPARPAIATSTTAEPG